MLETDEELEWAWLAGLFEGEGCVGRYFNNKAKPERGKTSYLAVEMKDRDILERLQRITGRGNIRAKPARGNSAATYIWAVQNKAGVVEICERILPYMGKRRTAKMHEVIADANG